MTRFVSLSSGSNGNCYYIGNDDVSFLIDVGIGGRTIRKRLGLLGIDINDVDFVLVSHDHVDHIKYLGSFTEHYHKPVFATKELHRALDSHFCTRGRMYGCVKNTEAGVTSECLGVKFTPFRVPHDAHDTVGYHIDFFGTTFTFITDLGSVTDEVVSYCSMASHLIVESNYDYDMLMNGLYTPELKRRIRNGFGHLSNDQTAELLRKVAGDDVQSVFLCHLSENNNTPELALESASAALKDAGATHILLKALPRRTCSELFEFES
ncbi:MAG: MBL fold metallo-hydrolase [Bacteroidales bacterium]|nr:MBL fold metallo-hydrolase [Bacteroidales bacterium]